MAKVNYKLAAVIFKNFSSEGGAKEGYAQLLSDFPDIEPADRDKILEIISDEAQHALILENMGLKYSGTVIASDGTAAILNELVDKIAKN